MTSIGLSIRPVLRYSGVAQALHWAIALLIVVAFAIGLLVDTFPPSWEDGIVNAHKLIGIAIITLVLVRLFWRAGHRPPEHASAGILLDRLSTASHVGLYVLMLAVPVIGLAFAAWRGQGIDFGLFAILALLLPDRATAGTLGELHEIGAYLLIGLAALHAAAGFWHHFVRKDTVLASMLPAR